MSQAFRKLIEDDAVLGLKGLMNTVKNLEATESFIVLTEDSATSNPPTLAEVNAIFDTPANIGKPAIGLIRDTVNSRYWATFSEPVSNTWYAVQLTLLV